MLPARRYQKHVFSAPRYKKNFSSGFFQIFLKNSNRCHNDRSNSKIHKSHSKAEEPANQAANVKMKKYTSTHNMNTPPTSNVKFFIASATTQGALSKDFKLLLKYLVKAYPENLRNEKLQQIYQRLSSKIH